MQKWRYCRTALITSPSVLFSTFLPLSVSEGFSYFSVLCLFPHLVLENNCRRPQKEACQRSYNQKCNVRHRSRCFVKTNEGLTGQAFVRILCVLIHCVVWDSIPWDGLHLNPWSMRQHPQVLKQPLPEKSHTDHLHFNVFINQLLYITFLA